MNNKDYAEYCEKCINTPLVTMNECRALLGLPTITTTKGINKTHRLEKQCKNCGSTLFKDNECVYCGTTINKGGD